MKKILLVIGTMVWLLGAARVRAADYVIEDFNSLIRVEQDRSLSVEETITCYYNVPKHGIIRVIPFAYTNRGVTLNTEIREVAVRDVEGNSVPFKVENYRQSKRIRIGEADRTVTGQQKYILRYKVGGAVRDYEENPEVYWNVTGHEWDTNIVNARAEVISPWAEAVKTDCFSGPTGSGAKECRIESLGESVIFRAENPVGINRDFTVVVGFNPVNQLAEPSALTNTANKLTDNWGYLVAVIPLLGMLAAWWKKGRDQRYQSGTVFYKPEEETVTTVSPFDRPHLPAVYGPIKGMTPAEVGAILDEQVNNSDLVSEIVELARLGYMNIKKLEKKILLWNDDDYLLIKLPKSTQGLKEHQKYLLDSIFSYKMGNDGARILAQTNNNLGLGAEELKSDKVRISDLKNKFYVHVGPFKRKVFQSLIVQEAIKEDPRMTAGKWLAAAVGLAAVTFWILKQYADSTGNTGPVLVLAGTAPIVLLLVAKMPRRTAWGYNLHRQAIGLKYYLNMGKWREEIAEKNLFLEEVLPLAIAVGAVKKLTADMTELQMEPPTYFQGSSLNSFSSDFARFSSVGAKSATSSPSSSGSGSWSGGSGFSGGSSGGGMGGGGGSSW